MHLKIRLLIVLGYLMAPVCLADSKPEATPSSTPNKVLFVGNSFSYFNGGLHNHVSSLVKAAGKWQQGQNRYRLKTLSGGRLQEHIAGMPYLADQPENRLWDVVVLQGHSNEPLAKNRKADFKLAAKRLAEVVRNHEAEPVLFMTWAYKNAPEMTAGLAREYVELANSLDALVVPVGLAFSKVNQHNPQIELYSADVDGFTENGDVIYKEDLKHPSLAGTYLAACMFYAAFYQHSPEGLAYTAGLEPEVAKRLQAAAWETYGAFYAP